MAKKKARPRETISARDHERFHLLMRDIMYAVEDSLGNADKAIELIGDVLARYKEQRLTGAMEDEDDD